MKKALLILCILGTRGISNAQNTYPWPTSGNVGIGTISPFAPLHVKDDASTGTIAIGHDIYPALLRSSAASGEFRLDNRTSFQGFITFYPNGQGSSLGSEGMRISSAGNIGIGTTTPAAKLDIRTNSSQLIGLSISPEGNHHSYLMINRKSGYDGGILWNRDGSHAWQQVNTDNGSMDWYSYAKGETGLTFGSNGDVGIGTTNPSEKLSVNGKIRAKEVKVEVTGWPDYVFDAGYELKQLEKLEGFIKTNKHLPDIPSATEVQREGINLGEMDARLLKKIEELTVYIIELKKEVDQLKKRKHEN